MQAAIIWLFCVNRKNKIKQSRNKALPTRKILAPNLHADQRKADCCWYYMSQNNLGGMFIIYPISEESLYTNQCNRDSNFQTVLNIVTPKYQAQNLFLLTILFRTKIYEFLVKLR